MENAIKFTAQWLEAFLIYSLVWTFHPVLSEVGRKKLDAAMQKKFNAARTGLGAYQQGKKRKMAEKAKQAEKTKEKTPGEAKKDRRRTMRGALIGQATPSKDQGSQETAGD